MMMIEPSQLLGGRELGAMQTMMDVEGGDQAPDLGHQRMAA